MLSAPVGGGQDKDYLQRQMNDVSIKYANAEERLQLLNTDLENVKRAREELLFGVPP